MARTRITPEKLKNAKWSVWWIAGGKKRIKRCGHDLPEAIRIHALLVKAGRKSATLRCDNVGHPAPEKYTHHPVVRQRKATRKVPVTKKYKKKKKGGGYKVVKRTEYVRKRVTIKSVTHVNRMTELNDKGIFWCPYCMKLREFKLPKKIWNTLIDEWLPNYDRVLICPMCSISTKDWHVMHENPKALQINLHKRRKRGGGGRSARRRRRAD